MTVLLRRAAPQRQTTVFAWSDAVATISSINFVWLLFKSADYLKAEFISLSQSLRWRRREQSSIEWALDRQGNLLVVADWFTSLFWVGFASSRRVFVSARATQVFIMPTAATIRERHLHEWRCGYCSRTATNRADTVVIPCACVYVYLSVCFMPDSLQWLKGTR